MNKSLIIIGLCMFLIIISSCSQDPFTILDNSVFVDDSNVYINVTPHTLQEDGWVYADFESKIFSGNIDFVFGFNTNNTIPKKLQRYAPYNETTWYHYTCEHEFTYTLNPNYFICYETINQNGTWINETRFEHSFEHGNIALKYANWSMQKTIEWINWNPTNSICYDFASMNKWYYATNQPINAEQMYKIRYWLDIPFNTNGKYALGIKPSSETIIEAIANEHLYLLDPWWDSDYDKKKPIEINVSANLVNYTVLLNVTYDSDMQNDFDDIRFTASDETTSLDYWVENKVDGSYVDVWVKFKEINITNGTQAYMYYNNDAVSNASNATNTFLIFEDFEDGAEDTFPDRFTIIGAGNWDVESTSAITGTYSLQLKATAEDAWEFLYHDNYIPADVQVSVKVKALDSLTAGGILIRNPSGDDGYSVLPHAEPTGTGDIRPHEFSGGGMSDAHSGDYSNNNWDNGDIAIVRANMSSTTLEYDTSIDGSLVAEDMTDDTWTTGGNFSLVGYNADNGRDIMFDDLRVRAYTLVEPLYAFGTESGSGVSITGIALKPTTAYSTSIFNCSAIVIEEESANDLDVIFTSYNNSVAYDTENQNDVASGTNVSSISIFPTPLNVGDIWKCGIYLEDATDSSKNATTNSSAITILSTAPVFDHAATNWSDWHSTNISMDINCSDVDVEDTITYNISSLGTNLTTQLAINGSNGLIYHNPIIYDVGEHSYNITCGDGTYNATQIFNLTVKQNVLHSTESNEDIIVEGDQIIFYLRANITDLSTSLSNVTLILNNTNYTSPSLSSDDNGTVYYYNYSKEIVIPDRDGNTTGIIQYWNWTYDIADVVDDYNTSTKNITIYSIELDDCSVYSKKILEYTLKDEEDRDITGLVNISIETDIQLMSYYNSSLLWNFSVEKAANPLTICITNYTLENSSFQMDVITRYSCDDHVTEYNYIVNYTLTNSTYINTTLYDLHDDDSTSFLITYKDSSYLPLEDAIIDLWRYYVGSGQYLSVEHAKTNDQGETRLHLVTEDVKYIFYVRKDGTLLYTSPEYLAICQATPCQINLQETQEEITHPDYQKVDNLEYTISLDKNTRTATATYSIDDGSSATLLINITTYDAYLNESVCTSTETSSGGTLTCIIPETFANTTYRLTLHKDEEFVADRSFNLNPHPLDSFGYTGIILVALMFLTLTLMAVPTSGAAAVFFGIMGLVFAGALNLFASGGEIFKGTLTLIWLVVAGGILIVKISHRRQA